MGQRVRPKEEFARPLYEETGWVLYDTGEIFQHLVALDDSMLIEKNVSPKK
jgi:hypothetical protein